MPPGIRASCLTVSQPKDEQRLRRLHAVLVEVTKDRPTLNVRVTNRGTYSHKLPGRPQTICVDRRQVDEMSHSALRGAMAHELAHLRDQHSRGDLVAILAASLVTAVSLYVGWLLYHDTTWRARSLAPLATLAVLAVLLLWLWLLYRQRRCEYRADGLATTFASHADLDAMLDYIADEDRRRGRVHRTSLWFLLCSTHPTPQQRRHALRAIAMRTRPLPARPPAP